MQGQVMPVTASYPGPQHMNGQMNDQVANPTGMSMPNVETDQLKARLYSYAPQQAPINTRALRFKKPTNAQIKRASIPSAPKLEPLVGLFKCFVFLQTSTLTVPVLNLAHKNHYESWKINYHQVTY